MGHEGYLMDQIPIPGFKRTIKNPLMKHYTIYRNKADLDQLKSGWCARCSRRHGHIPKSSAVIFSLLEKCGHFFVAGEEVPLTVGNNFNNNYKNKPLLVTA